MKSDWSKAEEFLKNDGVVVLPTDTLYGITGSAFSKKAVDKIYKMKGRNPNKPFIVLFNLYKDLNKFGIKIGEKKVSGSLTSRYLDKFWPGKVSIILPCKLKEFRYIHRGTNGIAFRMIGKRNKNLFNLIKKVGPIVAPSCNPEDLPVAKTIKEAKVYFNHIDRSDLWPDLYINSGKKEGNPSKLLKYQNGEFIVLRN